MLPMRVLASPPVHLDLHARRDVCRLSAPVIAPIQATAPMNGAAARYLLGLVLSSVIQSQESEGAIRPDSTPSFAVIVIAIAATTEP